MSQNLPEFNSRDEDNNPELLNQEIEALYEEVEDLHRETDVLTGLMAGGYAYFLQQLMRGHQHQTGLTAEACEQILLDALKRILSSQERFGYDFLTDIQSALQKMSQPLALEIYLQKIDGQAEK